MNSYKMNSKYHEALQDEENILHNNPFADGRPSYDESAQEETPLPWSSSSKKLSSETEALQVPLSVSHNRMHETVTTAKISQHYPWEERPAKSNVAILPSESFVLGGTGSPSQIPVTATPSYSLQSSSTPFQNNNEKQANWPICWPFVYHDIVHDIPPVGQSYVRTSYFLWQLSLVSYLLNVVATIGLITSKVEEYSSVGGLILSIGYLVIFPALSFFGWHMVLYKAVKTDTALRYIFWFISFGCQLAVFVFLAIGFWAGGGGGLLGAIDMFKAKCIVPGVLSLICTVFLVLYVIYGLVYFRRVWLFYRHGGHSLEKARNEAAMSAAQNPALRKAAFKNAMSAV